MNRKLLLLALSCFMVSAYAVDQQVYKWTDAAGVVHFSDSPPPKDAKDVQLMRVSSTDRPRNVEVTGNSEPGSKPAEDASGGNAAAADPKDARAKECATARNNLDLLQSKMPVSVTGPDGKALPLDDKARAAQIAAANANIELYCKP
ncbi:MAG: DUF4124 domain-containing protein [Proteobacteria bacterium]|nr:DUF4124 domain-containing protein [Pseudomonadota bacterium]